MYAITHEGNDYTPDGRVKDRPPHCSICNSALPQPEPCSIVAGYAQAPDGTAFCLHCAAEWDLTVAAQTGRMFAYPHIPTEHQYVRLYHDGDIYVNTASVNTWTGYQMSDPGSVSVGRTYRSNWGDERQSIAFRMCGRPWHGIIFNGMYLRAQVSKRRAS